MADKKIAIMQPYLFPYIGYFQLIESVDMFVLYNDVSFIKQGWINRNRILFSGNDLYFSAPISNLSSFRKINDTEISKDLFPIWRTKFLKTIEHAYSKAPYYKSTKNIISDVLFRSHLSISDLAIDSIITVCNYLNIDTEFKTSACEYGNEHLCGSDRLIDICLREQANIYINAVGGRKMYDKNSFLDKGLQLYFLISIINSYTQLDKSFVPGLSIIDVMMFNPIDKIHEYLKLYELI